MLPTGHTAGSQVVGPPLTTSDAREGHPVPFLGQVQPARHLVNHHLDLVFVQRAENGHMRKR